MTSKHATSPRTVAVSYATAAAIWLGLTLWAIGSDCGPQSIDGQCGMSTFFGIVYATAGGLLAIVFALASGASPNRVFGAGQRISGAALAALSSGIVAVDVFTVLDNILMRGQPLSEGAAFGVRMLPVIAFVGAPFAFTILYIVAAASYRRIQKRRYVSALWVCGIAVVPGILLGLVTPRGLAFGFRDRPWMVIAGLILGLATGWMFWRVGLRGTSSPSLPSSKIDTHNAI